MARLGRSYPAKPIFGRAVPAATVTSASIAATDAADVAALTTTVTTGAAVAATDAPDVAAITAANWTTSQIAANDAPDVAAITTTVTTGADISTPVDAPDVAAITTTVTTGASVAATDGADAAAITADGGTAVAAPAPTGGAGTRKRRHVFIGDRHYYVNDVELAELLYQLAREPKPKIAQNKPAPPKKKIAAVIKAGVAKPVNLETAKALEAQAKSLRETEVLRHIQQIILQETIRREREDDEDVEMLLLAS